MDVSFPDFAHLVTVFGSTRNMLATSAGVSNASASVLRAFIAISDSLRATPDNRSHTTCPQVLAEHLNLDMTLNDHLSSVRLSPGELGHNRQPRLGQTAESGSV